MASVIEQWKRRPGITPWRAVTWASLDSTRGTCETRDEHSSVVLKTYKARQGLLTLDAWVVCSTATGSNKTTSIPPARELTKTDHLDKSPPQHRLNHGKSHVESTTWPSSPSPSEAAAHRATSPRTAPSHSTHGRHAARRRSIHNGDGARTRSIPGDIHAAG